MRISYSSLLSSFPRFLVLFLSRDLKVDCVCWDFLLLINLTTTTTTTTIALAVVQVYLLGRLCVWAMGSSLRCDFLQWQFTLKRSYRVSALNRAAKCCKSFKTER